MSASVNEIATSVIIAIGAFILGNFRREISLRMRTRRTRRYWGPLRDRGLAIVLGSFPSDAVTAMPRTLHGDPRPSPNFEPYGLVGFGDLLALIAVQGHLKELGLSDVVVTHAGDIRSVKSRNLILLGGPDENSATDLAMEAGHVPVTFESTPDHRYRLRAVLASESRDSGVEEHVLVPTFSQSSRARITKDFGFVAQVRSPYDHDATAILLVGAYGAGTAGAAQLVTTAYGVSRLGEANRPRIAVFHVDVSRDGHLSAPQIDHTDSLRTGG